MNTKKNDLSLYPQWVCDDCGNKYGRRKSDLATWHHGKCDVCETMTMVTEPRDFGHLKNGWQNNKRSRKLV